ncbi:MAG TPA: cytochrome P450 [Candidatus Xenobia bacterium]
MKIETLKNNRITAPLLRHFGQSPQVEAVDVVQVGEAPAASEPATPVAPSAPSAPPSAAHLLARSFMPDHPPITSGAGAERCPFLNGAGDRATQTATAAAGGPAAQAVQHVEPTHIGLLGLRVRDEQGNNMSPRHIPEYITRLHELHGDVIWVDHSPAGPLIFTSRPADIKQMLQNTDSGDKTADKTNLHYHGNGFMVGDDDNVLWGSGQNWETSHTIIKPFMDGRAMNNDPTAANVHAILQEHVQGLKDEVHASGGEKQIELRDMLQNTTLDVALQTLCGVKLPKDQLDKAHDAFRHVAEWTLNETINRTPVSLAKLMGPLPAGKALRHSYHTLYQLADAITAFHRDPAAYAKSAMAKEWSFTQSPAAMHAGGKDSGPDIIDALLTGKKEDGQPFDDPKIRHEVLTLLFAGHETTTAQIGWALTEYARDPAAYQQLQADADAQHIDEHPKFNQVSRKDSMARLTMEETLRKYPSVYLLARKATQDVEMGPDNAKVHVPKGAHVILSLAATGRDSSWEVTDAEGKVHTPNDFFPTRVAERKRENRATQEAGGERAERANNYPFGAGKRVCLGIHLARMEYQMMLEQFARTFDIKPDLTPMPAPKSEIAQHPEDGGRITIRERAAE